MLRSSRLALGLAAVLAAVATGAAPTPPVPYLVADINPDDYFSTLMGWHGAFDIPPPRFRVEDSHPLALVTDGSRVYFSADDKIHGREPWVSDGTPEGTRLVVDLAPGARGSQLRLPVYMVVVGDALIFDADPTVQQGTWAVGPRGTRRIDWPYGGEIFGPYGGRYFFFDASGHLWRTDGYFVGLLLRCARPQREQCIRDAPLGPNAQGDEGFYYVYGEEKSVGWIDAASGQHHLLLRQSKGRFSSPVPFAGGVAVTNEDVGHALWFVDRPEVPVELDGDLLSNRFPYRLAKVGDGVLLARTGERMIVTDGTAAGTREIPPIQLSIGDPLLLPDRAIFFGRTDECGFLAQSYLHSEDRFESECLLPDLPMGSNVVRIWSGGVVLFQAWHPERPVETWAWGGMPGSLRHLVPLTGIAVHSVEARDGLLLLWGVDRKTSQPDPPNVNFELWATDGTSPGTRRLLGPWLHTLYGKGYAAEAEATLSNYYVLTEDRLFLSARFDERGFELWAVDLADFAEPDLRLDGGKYRLKVRWRNQHGGFEEGEALARPETAQSGFFWFFRRENLELVAKVLDGSAVNGHDWVFWGGITDLEYWLDVTDVESGETRTYHHPPGDLCGGSDTAAFAHVPSGGGAPSTGAARADLSRAGSGIGLLGGGGAGLSSAAAPATSGVSAATSPYGPCPIGALCLGDDARFAARVRFANQYAGGAEGTGRPVPATDRSGWFWFFRPDNLEVMVKVLDGTPVNGHHWVLTGGLTTLEHWLEVTDRSTGTARTYHHPAGSSCGRADTSAF